MKSKILGLLAAAPLCAICSANAAPVFYTNVAAFQGAVSGAGIALSTEGFESATDLGGTVTFPGGSATGDDVGICPASCDTAQSVTAGSNALGWFTSGSGSGILVFSFSSPVNAFGIDIVDLGDPGFGPTTLTLTTAGGSQVLFSIFSGANGNVLFGGFLDTVNSYVSATFTSTAAGDFIGFDRMQTGTVPEPGTLALLGLGLLGLGVTRRKAA